MLIRSPPVCLQFITFLVPTHNHLVGVLYLLKYVINRKSDVNTNCNTLITGLYEKLNVFIVQSDLANNTFSNIVQCN